MPYSLEEGGGLDGVALRLIADVSPSASTFAELCDAEHFGPRAWYVDAFDDFRTQ